MPVPSICIPIRCSCHNSQLTSRSAQQDDFLWLQHFPESSEGYVCAPCPHQMGPYLNSVLQPMPTCKASAWGHDI